MIFQHTLEAVLDGTKTQTRRIVKQGQKSRMLEQPFGGYKITDVLTANNHSLYRLNSTYSVQAGRGQKGVARIEITRIRREDVRDISDEDVNAEGFATKESFLKTWCAMHYKPAYHLAPWDYNAQFLDIYFTCQQPKYFQAWVIDFQKVDER